MPGKGKNRAEKRQKSKGFAVWLLKHKHIL